MTNQRHQDANVIETRLANGSPRACTAGLAVSVLVLALMSMVCGSAQGKSDAEHPAWDDQVTQGALRTVDDAGKMVECPLTHTDVKADISGYLARVRVTQTFTNPIDKPIEATYVFPLPHHAAVDQLTLIIGDRRITGTIKRRAEAREIYEQALAQGQTTALLEQERPNIFTQSVGNIPPGAEVRVEISYVDSLRYDMGVYEFQFPMVVGPRYNPGSSISAPPTVQDGLRGKVAPPPADTSRVPDASRINPPVLKPGFRNGHDISLTVNIRAGVPLRDVEVSNHQVSIVQTSLTSARVELDSSDTVPNKDFLMRFTVVGEKPEVAVLNHTGDYSDDAQRLGRGYFMLMVQPREHDKLGEMPPREIVFLVDVSGSMRGEKTAKVIDAMRSMLNQCRPVDTVQVVTFANTASKLFDKPVPVVPANVRRALDFSSQLQGRGGTQMLKGVKMAIDEPIDPERLRIVVMLTDGFIGNESEIISHVGKKCGDQIRFWAIGIGSSPNMFLIDGVARQGGGLGKQLTLKDNTEALTEEIMARIQRAQLAQVEIDWGHLPVRETYPARIPELWAGRPIIIFGRYGEVDQKAQITIRGKVEGEPVQWQIEVDLTEPQAEHDVLARVWARRKIEDLMQQTFYMDTPAVQEEVTAIALDYKLMTQYTSFVAVDESAATSKQDPPVRMAVPVPLPEGAEWEGFFGEAAHPEPFAMSVSRPARPARGGAVLSSLGRSSGAIGGRRPTRSASKVRLEIPALGFTTRFRLAPQRSAESLRGAQVHRAFTGKAVRLFQAGEPRNLYDDYARMGDVQADPQRSELLQALSRELQAQLRSDQLTLAQATLTAIRLLKQFVADSPPNEADQIPTPVELHRRELQVWRTMQPALDNQLKLRLRDASLPQALSKIGEASDLRIQIVDGAEDDVLTLLNQSGPLEVRYFDARDKTVWQTLDEILYPLKLEWYVDDRHQVVVTTARRRNVPTIWVYHVAGLAWPLKSEFASLSDQNEINQWVAKQRERFLEVVKRQLKPTKSDSVAWLTGSHLMVYGNAKMHAQMSQLIEVLSDAGAVTDHDLAEFAEVTRKRWQHFVKQRDDILQKTQRGRAEQLRSQSSWMLLAEALVGRCDLESLTQLRAAWTQLGLDDLPRSADDRRRIMRSYWALQRASHLLPEQAELKRTADQVADEFRPHLQQVARAAMNATDDQDLVLAATFACLAHGEEDRLKQLGQALSGKDHVAAKMVQAVIDPNAAAVEQLLNRDLEMIDSDELIVLTALASHRAGRQTWQTFRGSTADLLGRRPLLGELILLINRLGGHDALYASH